MSKILAYSIERWNGGVAAKRQWGGSTMTRFTCFEPQDEHVPSRWFHASVGGKTPGERKTNAIALARIAFEKRTETNNSATKGTTP